jgi:hypothetical protein
MVHVSVADMVVRRGLELGLYIGELVFQHGEIDANVVLGPELLLVTDRAVRTAPDEVSQGLREAYHIHGDDTGGIAYFQCPINVKANELGQACASCIGAIGATRGIDFWCGLCLPGYRPASSLARSPPELAHNTPPVLPPREPEYDTEDCNAAQEAHCGHRSRTFGLCAGATRALSVTMLTSRQGSAHDT